MFRFCNKRFFPLDAQAPYIHDFGSILNFAEYALGVNTNPIAPVGGIGWQYGYPYADYLAPDAYTSLNCTQSVCPYSLSDFFVPGFGSPSTFSPISAPYKTTCFLTPKTDDCFGKGFEPADPDSDAAVDDGEQ